MKIKNILYLLMFPLGLSAQTKHHVDAKKAPNRPKLVVGIVVDQMRWDYLYRFSDRYSNNGFKRLLNEGTSCENTYINYLPSYTACGHSSIYTGSVPSINGITGNDWIEADSRYRMYCTADSTVKAVGSNSSAGKMSPKNLLVTTFGDELRLATNFKSKVIGIALKDRGGILPGGHTANAAYWFDDSNLSWITSTFYRNDLPSWVTNFNKKDLKTTLTQDWNTLYPIDTYLQSTKDNVPYEGKFLGEARPVFPHKIPYSLEAYSNSIRNTPFANTMTFDFAKEAIIAEELGKDNITDLLAVSISGTDYIGHQYGPNAIETEDTYLRLDKDIASFLAYLDKHVGKGNYTVFLTADHGGAHNPNFLIDNKVNAGFFDGKTIQKELNLVLEDEYKFKNIVSDIFNYNIYFNKNLPSSINKEELKKDCISYLQSLDGVAYVVDFEQITSASIPSIIKEKIINGYNHKRNGSLQIVLEAGWFQGYGITGTTHGNWHPYDTHIPLVFMGWGIKKGEKLNRKTFMNDIAPTISSLLHIQEPNGNIGSPISEIYK